MRVALRPMDLGDIPQVLDIEKESFPTQWPTTSYRRELQRNRIARYIVAYDPDSRVGELDQRAAAATNGGRLWERLMDKVKRFLSGANVPNPTSQIILGFVGIWFMHDEAHITAIAVREVYRRRGIGELLLLATVDLAQENGLEAVSLEVRASNHGAQSLYRKYGFEHVGVRKGYYSDDHEDAHIMTTEKIKSPAFQERLERLRGEASQRWHLGLYPGGKGVG